MAKINLLDSEVYNRIAAGEVIENPKSIVKELVENSIDAGATYISVEISGGGIDCIKVFDNGNGMGRVDLEKSVLPHATSKVCSINDLNNISTLGFRGEALPSIASVSNLKIISRERGCSLGNYIEYGFGLLKSVGDCGAPEGTTVIVENLFEKIPARKKFLKKSTQETAEISSLILRYIIANYNISIKYTVDGNTIYHSDGLGLQSAIYTVYGKEFNDNLIFVENVKNDTSIFGFVGKPGFNKHNRTYQTLIVNGRYVVNTEITFVVQSCYREFLMSREFPVWILFIETPSDMVDVNVHPNKLEVKFADFSRIKRQIYTTILDAVRSLSGMPDQLRNALISGIDEQVFTFDTEPETNEDEDISKKQQEFTFNSKDLTNLDKLNKACETLKNTSFSEKSLFGNILDGRAYTREEPSISDNYPTDKKNTASFSLDTSIHAPKEFLWSNKQPELDKKLELRVHCKLFNTYILVEFRNDIYIIDQHAAHERIIFDKIMTSYNSDSLAIQPMLLPYIFDLSLEERQFIDENLSMIEKMGFSITKLSGNSYSLNSIPYCCTDINCNAFIGQLFESFCKNDLKHTDIIREKIAKAACTAAIKGNDELSVDEIYKLLLQLTKTEKLFCPHGRPIIVKISRTEIEKWFKRIV